ncbi:MAG: hypothetical protein WCY25_06605 [Moheibacter sp.]
MKNYLLLFSLLVSLVAFSQTPLEKGDIMILGVNASNKNNTCSNVGADPDYDNIYLVSFVNIPNGTTFQITDNRYISGNSFGNTEGFISFRRTGGAILAGTIFKIDFPNVISVGTILNGWTVDSRSGSFALSSTSEQIILFQNATWNNAAGNVSGTNLKYLLAYNTKRDWLNTVNATNSLLPSSLICHHISSPSGTRNFAYYSGSTLENISHGEWLVRILNNVNWTNAPSCTDFSNNVPTGIFPIRTTIPTQEICSGEPLNNLEVINETNVVQYQWYSNNLPINTGGTLIPGATTHTFTPSNTTIGTTYYYCEMTISLPLNTGTVSNNECSFFSNVFQVTVNPNPATSPVIPL